MALSFCLASARLNSCPLPRPRVMISRLGNLTDWTEEGISEKEKQESITPNGLPIISLIVSRAQRRISKTFTLLLPSSSSCIANQLDDPLSMLAMRFTFATLTTIVLAAICHASPEPSGRPSNPSRRIRPTQSFTSAIYTPLGRRPQDWIETNDDRWAEIADGIEAGHIDRNTQIHDAAQLFQTPPPLHLRLPRWFMERCTYIFPGMRFRNRDQLNFAIEHFAQRWRDRIENYEEDLESERIRESLIETPPPPGIGTLPEFYQELVQNRGLGQRIPLDWNWTPTEEPLEEFVPRVLQCAHPRPHYI